MSDAKNAATGRRIIPIASITIGFLVLAIVMYNSKMSSKGKRQDGAMSVPVLAQEIWWGDSLDAIITASQNYDYQKVLRLNSATTSATIASLPPVSTTFAVRKLTDGDIPSPFSSPVSVIPQNNFVRLGWDDGFTPAPITPTPVPTIPPTPAATPSPTATIAPTPSPIGTPGINVPSAVTFVWPIGAVIPTPMPVIVRTSNGAAWTSSDNSPWFDTSPENHGASGDPCVIKPHANATYTTQNITFSATGLTPKVTRVIMTRPTPAPSATPIRTPTPLPSSPTPTCTPCACGNP